MKNMMNIKINYTKLMGEMSDMLVKTLIDDGVDDILARGTIADMAVNETEKNRKFITDLIADGVVSASTIDFAGSKNVPVNIVGLTDQGTGYAFYIVNATIERPDEERAHASFMEVGTNLNAPKHQPVGKSVLYVPATPEKIIKSMVAQYLGADIQVTILEQELPEHRVRTVIAYLSSFSKLDELEIKYDFMGIQGLMYRNMCNKRKDVLVCKFTDSKGSKFHDEYDHIFKTFTQLAKEKGKLYNLDEEQENEMDTNKDTNALRSIMHPNACLEGPHGYVHILNPDARDLPVGYSLRHLARTEPWLTEEEVLIFGSVMQLAWNNEATIIWNILFQAMHELKGVKSIVARNVFRTGLYVCYTRKEENDTACNETMILHVEMVCRALVEHESIVPTDWTHEDLTVDDAMRFRRVVIDALNNPYANLSAETITKMSKDEADLCDTADSPFNVTLFRESYVRFGHEDYDLDGAINDYDIWHTVLDGTAKINPVY